MLTVLGDRQAPFCDGISRRSFLRAGFLGLAGLSLADVLRLRAQATGAGSAHGKTSVIFIELAGGPSQFETYDPKPSAPVEFRGAFSAIGTNVPRDHRMCRAQEIASVPEPINAAGRLVADRPFLSDL